MRVAIVGGGFAGIAAAWSLSQQKDYEVHVYEASWRLGGKAASTRAADGRIRTNSLQVWLGFYENAFRMMRKCYAEVETYGWGPGRPPPEALVYGRMEDAFFPEPNVGAGVRNPNIGADAPHLSQDWAVWSAYLPPANGLPGEPLDESSNPFTLASYLLRGLSLLKALMLSIIRAPGQDPPGEPRPDERSMSDQVLNFNYSVDGTVSLQLVIERMVKLLRAGTLTGAAAWLQAVTILEVWLQDFNFGPQVSDSALSLAEAVVTQTRKLLHDFVGIDPEIRIRTEIIDLVLTIAVGLFRDRVLLDNNGLDSINQYDFRAWLMQHGATKDSVSSKFLTAVYDLAFAYSDGDTKKPSLAAGVALRGLLRTLFTYRGSMFWRLRSGMGEAVFAPLYQVLKSQNRKVNKEPLPWVRFHFLHELKGVRFGESIGKRYVDRLEFTIAGPRDIVDTLSEDALDDSGCWPDGPVRFESAAGIDDITLELGKDFDAVIFAIGVEDFKAACASNADPKLYAEWQRTCDNVKTIATKSAQVWLTPNLESLGWYQGSGLVAALGLSFDTWVDMTPSLATEARLAGHVPNAGSLAYFCAPVRDSEFSELQKQAGETLDAFQNDVLRQRTNRRRTNPGARMGARDAEQFSERAINRVAAGARWVEHRDKIRPALAVYAHTLMSGSQAKQKAARERAKSHIMAGAANQKVGENLTALLRGEVRNLWPALPHQNQALQRLTLNAHAQANFQGSDRYTLSEHGLILHRISPLDRSVENMTVAGDWTACGLDVGCVEAAVMSGLLASHAISGNPALNEIIGYDHP